MINKEKKKERGTKRTIEKIKGKKEKKGEKETTGEERINQTKGK